ncbi:MAG: hypothetical protein PHN39_01080 [Candidatus Pacebacteria bacterium]|nr:hypothetical protein [Candidatus Paceibacterota bacterium]
MLSNVPKRNIALAAAAILVVASGVILNLTGIWKIDWSIFQGGSSSKIIEDALEKTLTTGAFKFETEITADLSGIVNLDEATKGTAENQTVLSLALKVSGFLNQKDKNNIKQNVLADAILQSGGLQMNGNGELRIIGEKTFFKINSLPEFLGNLGLAKGQWVYLDKNSTPGEAPELTKEQYQLLASELAALLKGKGLFGIRKTVGIEKVKEMQSKHYIVYLNKTAVKKVAPDFFKLIAKYLPEQDRADYESKLNDLYKELPKAIDELWKTTGGLTFNIWIADDRVVQIKWEKEMDLSNLEALKAQIKKARGNLSISLAYFDFDQEVAVEEPQDARPLDEVLATSTAPVSPTQLLE